MAKFIQILHDCKTPRDQIKRLSLEVFIAWLKLRLIFMSELFFLVKDQREFQGETGLNKQLLQRII